jgi:Sporulation and spore germination
MNHLRARTAVRVRGIAAVGVCAVIVAGCAISTQDRATVVPDNSVPFALLEPDSAPPPSNTTITGAHVTIFLVKNRMIVPVDRTVTDATPEALIALLAADPTEAEVSAGLRSELATEGGPALVRSSELNRGVATVNLAGAFAGLDSDGQLFAIAQLVDTLTSQPGTGQVAFTLENAPVEVPVPAGTTTGNPVTASDYSVLISP